MSKIKVNCTHCGREVEWYKSFMHETIMKHIGDKYYCETCLQTITTFWLKDCAALDWDQVK